jgi:hypothetical protein
MAQGKYLVILLLLAHSIQASPWLPDEGRYIYIGSSYITGKASEKVSQKESKLYYQLEQDAVYLEKEKSKYLSDKNLTDQARANRIKEINDRIKNIKRLQDNFLNYYPKRTISHSIEYGVSRNYSFGAKITSNHKLNFLGHSRDNTGVALFQKIKLKQTDRYIVSLQPLVSVEREGVHSTEKVSGELRLLLGESKKHKLGKTFNTIEIAPGIARTTLQYSLNYTTGIEIKSGILLMLQTYNSFRPKVHKIYKQTSLEQFSIAKPIEIGNSANPCKVTLQLGYFQEFSVSARKSIASGIQFSIWAEI